MELLKLGQKERKTDEAVWLNIITHHGAYMTWTEADDKELRELLGIAADKPLPGIKIRRWGHTERTAYYRKGLRKYRRLGSIPAELDEKLTRDSAAHAVLMDWRGIAQIDGAEVEYTPEAGAQAFTDDPDFYEAVVAAAITEENFRAGAIKEDADSLGED